jgi:hypothetical protein
MGREKWVTESTTLARQADKHACYAQSVQSPRHEINTLIAFYQHMVQQSDGHHAAREPVRFREDFCGTALLCREWLKRGGPNREAIGVDLDAQVLDYARRVTFQDQQDNARLRLVHADVLSNLDDIDQCAVDLLCALNYGRIIYCSLYIDLVTVITMEIL